MRQLEHPYHVGHPGLGPRSVDLSDATGVLVPTVDLEPAVHARAIGPAAAQGPPYHAPTIGWSAVDQGPPDHAPTIGCASPATAS